jgi:hypothetical protein
MMSQNASGLELNLTGRPVSDLFAEAFADDGPMPFSSAGGRRAALTLARTAKAA